MLGYGEIRCGEMVDIARMDDIVVVVCEDGGTAGTSVLSLHLLLREMVMRSIHVSYILLLVC